VEIQVVVPKPTDERVRKLMKELEAVEPGDPRRIYSLRQACRDGSARKKATAKAGYMISAVAELYKLHPQTLRLYERVGLLKPSRSQGILGYIRMAIWSGWM